MYTYSVVYTGKLNCLFILTLSVVFRGSPYTPVPKG